MSGAYLDMMGAQSTSVAPRKKADRRRSSSYGGRSAATAAIHGGIGSVSAGIYKSFRERFMTSDAGSGSSSAAGDYRVLRQRDAEAGNMQQHESSSSGSSSDEQEDSQLSSSSIDDLFANEKERRKWRRKIPERNAKRRKMGQRTGASASCEDLILEISLPDEQMAADKMSLTLHEKDLDLGTGLYRLKLPLPHAVDVDRCKAKYDSEQCKLRLTLRLRRELDYVNF